MNKAEKFVQRIFEENLLWNSIGDAILKVSDEINNKFTSKGKKIPPEYNNALNNLIDKIYVNKG